MKLKTLAVKRSPFHNTTHVFKIEMTMRRFWKPWLYKTTEGLFVRCGAQEWYHYPEFEPIGILQLDRFEAVYNKWLYEGERESKDISLK